jgi:PAS domain S-box-containing protein
MGYADMQKTEIQNAKALGRLALRGEIPLEVLLSEEDSIPGLWLYLLVVHWLVLLGMGLRTWMNLAYYAKPGHQAWLHGLFVFFPLFFLYLATMMLVEWRRPQSRHGLAWVFAKVFLDTLFFSAFYALSGKAESDTFLLLLLPLMVAIERMNFRRIALVVAAQVLCLGVVVVSLSGTLDRSLGATVISVVFARALLVAFVGLAAVFLSQTGQVRRLAFVGTLEAMGKGVSIIDPQMRLLWMNKAEQDLVQERGQKLECYRAFRRRDKPCPGCPALEAISAGEKQEALMPCWVKGEERIFEVAAVPIHDQRERITAVLCSVDDVTDREQEKQRLATLRRISLFARVAEIGQPKALHRAMWWVLSGVVARDGLGCDRAMMLLQVEGRLVGYLGMGALAGPDAEAQRRRRRESDLRMDHVVIARLVDDVRLSSRHLRRAIPAIRLEEGLSHWLMGELANGGTGQPRFVEPDLEGPWRQLRAALAAVGVRSFAIAPLLAKGELLGILVADNPSGKRLAVERGRTLEFLQLYASEAAMVAESARMHSHVRNLLAGSPSAIIAVDRHGIITQFNRACERILGYPVSETLGRPIESLYAGGREQAREINRLLILSDKERKPLADARVTMIGRDGNTIPIRFSAAMLRDEHGNRVGSIGFLTDVREVHALEDEHHAHQDVLTALEQRIHGEQVDGLRNLRDQFSGLLEEARKACELEYMILFASTREGETVLQPVAWAGLQKEVELNAPHFNWRKAGLLPRAPTGAEQLRDEDALIRDWQPDESWHELVWRGIRGPNREHLASFTFGVPVRMADTYRALLVAGPHLKPWNPMDRRDFLKNLGVTIGMPALSWLHTLQLRAEREEADKSLWLIKHRMKMLLNIIDGKFGVVRLEAPAGSPADQAAAAGEELVRGADAALMRSLTSHYAEMESEDLVLRSYPLAVLVQNCVEGFGPVVERAGRTLVVDPNVENLPDAVIDHISMIVALNNLLDNALKYSHADTPITVRTNYDSHEAVITIEDLGERMPEDARDNLVRPGGRWAMSARARKIPGTGFGLWEVSSIVAAHGGSLDFSSVEHYHRGKRFSMVRVWVSIPLSQGRQTLAE